MEKLYIKIDSNGPVNHPMLESNVLEVHQIPAITEQFLQENGYARFENMNVPESKLVMGQDGYELCEDGVVRPKLLIRDLTQEEKMNDWVRSPRDFWLVRSDWTQTVDAPFTAEKKAEWAAYRQELRDLTALYEGEDLQSPADVVWPTKPE
jgi:hypothetical protein